MPDAPLFLDCGLSIHHNDYMARTVTITVDDTVYETLKPLIEQQSIGEFLAKVIEKNPQSVYLPHFAPHLGIAELRGSLHRVDTSDIREENDRVV